MALIALLVPYRISSYTAVEDTPIETPSEAPQAPVSVDTLIHDISVEYGVSEAVMRTVIKCESNFNPRAIGDGGYSRGLVQIHSKYWPEITDAQAFDPKFAITFLADKLSKDQGYLWTCWRNHVSTL